MVDREDRRLAQCGESPRPGVESGTDDYHLLVARFSNRVVDRHRPWDNDLGASHERFDGETLPPVRRRNARTSLLDSDTLLRSEELRGYGVGETPDGQPAVGNGPPLTHEDCGAAPAIPVHDG